MKRAFLFFAGIFLITNCGYPYLLEEGIYDVLLTVKYSDWHEPVGETTTSSWTLTIVDDIYSIQVEQADWRLVGHEQDSIVVLTHKQTLTGSTEICESSNELYAELVPRSDGKSFVGTASSVLHMCNLNPCGFGAPPIDECALIDIDVFESHEILGELEE